jgi:CheY-like chemotaxis protein
MAKRYYLAKIRALLTNGFSDTELRSFCFDQSEFRPVYEKLTANSFKDDIVGQMLEYADRTEKFESLLNWASKKNPIKFNSYKPYCCARILLVDDNEHWRKMLGGLLQEEEKWGYQVVTVASREEAIRHIKSDEPYDLAILDLRLVEDEKNFEGVTLGEWLRNNGYDIHIIIMSAYGIDADILKRITLFPFKFVAVDKSKIRCVRLNWPCCHSLNQ